MTDSINVMGSRKPSAPVSSDLRVQVREGDYIRDVPLAVPEQDPAVATACTASPSCKAQVLPADMAAHVQWHADRAAEVRQLSAKLGITIKL